MRAPHVIGRYVLYGEIASGGMATVHLGRLLGAEGFARTVAIKRLHAQYAKDPDFVSMFLDEARVAARVQHPNVVQTIDVVSLDDEIFVVMEYVLGESLARLGRAVSARGERIPPRIVASIITGVLHGLHAAHEAKNERGEPLGMVHRDVSPQNVMVARDGTPRVVDFGVAKAVGRLQTTRDGQLKGKLAYMAPEQLQGLAVTRRTDIFAAGILFWESLTGERLFSGENEAHVITNIVGKTIVRPSEAVKDLTSAYDEIAMMALSRNPAQRYATAEQMALAIERTGEVALASEVSAWLSDIAGPVLAERAARVAQTESTTTVLQPDSTPPETPEMPSQRSIMSVATSPLPEVTQSVRPRARRTFGWLAIGIALGIMVVFAFARRGTTTAVGSASPGVTSAIGESMPAPVKESTPSEPTPSEPIVVATTTRVEASPSSAAAEAPTSSPSVEPTRPPPPMTIVVSASAAPPPPERPRVPTPVLKATQTPPPVPKKNCDPPYRLDGAGHKIFKVECL